jgi:hypothetical protein
MEITLDRNFDSGYQPQDKFKINFSEKAKNNVDLGVRLLLNVISMVKPKFYLVNFQLLRDRLSYNMVGCTKTAKIEVHRIFPENEFLGYKKTSTLNRFFKNEKIISEKTLVKVLENVPCFMINSGSYTLEGVTDLNRHPDINTLKIEDFGYNYSIDFLNYIQSELFDILDDSNIIILRAWVDGQEEDYFDKFIIQQQNDKLNMTNSENDGTKGSDENSLVETNDSDENSSVETNNSDESSSVETNSSHESSSIETNNSHESSSIETNSNNQSMNSKNTVLTEELYLAYRSNFISSHTQFTNMRNVPNYKFQTNNFKIEGDNKIVSNPIIVNKNSSYEIDSVDSLLFKPNDLQALFVMDEYYKFSTKKNNGTYVMYPFFEVNYDMTSFKTSEWKYDLQLNIAIFGNDTETGQPILQLYARNEDLITPPEVEKLSYRPVRVNILSDQSSNITTLENNQNFANVEENLCRIYDVEEFKIGTMVRFISCKIFNKPVSYDFIRWNLLSSYIFINLSEGNNRGALKGIIALNNPQMRGKLITSDSFCLSSFYKFLTKYDKIDPNDKEHYYDLLDTPDDYYLDIVKISNFVWDFRFRIINEKIEEIQKVEVFTPFSESYFTFTRQEIFDYTFKRITLDDPNIGGKILYVTVHKVVTNSNSVNKIDFNCAVIERFYFSNKAVREFYNRLIKREDGDGHVKYIVAGVVSGVVVLSISIVLAICIYRKCYRNTVLSLPKNLDTNKAYDKLNNSTSMVIERSNNLSIVDPRNVEIQL